jgi:serine/threonine-protein kinase
MAATRLDTLGRLTAFHGVPPQVVEGPGAPAAAADWSTLFAEAGLDHAKFRKVEPRWSPPQAFDEQAAWEGTYDEQPDLPLRVEAASFRGRPVYFEVVHPWNRPARQQQLQLPPGVNFVQATITGLFILILVGAALLARRNLRLGRGDRRGAFRLAAFAGVMAMLTSVFSTHHVPTWDELGLFLRGVSFSLLVGGMIWLVYVALEPFVRRRWPGMIISWNRLLVGDFRDPLVGRDLLIGAAFGFGMVLLTYVQISLPGWLGLPPSAPLPVLSQAGMLGPQHLASMLAAQALNSLIFPSSLLFLLLLFTILLRRRWAAVALLLLPFLLFGLASENPLLGTPVAVCAAGVYLLVLIRFGLLALVFMQFFALSFTAYPITPDLTAWHAGSTIFVLALTAALLAFGFHTSLAGQKLFSGSLVED